MKADEYVRHPHHYMINLSDIEIVQNWIETKRI